MFRVMKAKNAEPMEIHGIRLGPELTEEQAKAIFALGEQAVVFALLAQAKILADRNGDRSAQSRQDDPSCPSGQKAPYEKPEKKGRKKKPGCKPGHEGHCRAKPDHIDREVQHRESHCPECGGKLTKCHVSRKRYIEDIPQDVHVEVTEHTIHRDWCPRGRKMVEPKVPHALPNATIGNRLLVMSAWLHYALGNTISQILSVFNVHLLRDLERVETYKDTSGDWARFAKKLRRLIRDAIRLRKRWEDLDPTTYERRYHRMEQRLQLMIEMEWTNRQVRRLIKRLRRHQHELFTFVLEHEVPFENNFAERIIRLAVIMRKNSYNNRSDKGASTQAILMSVFTTLKQRGLNPIKIVEQALRTYITTGKLPALKDFAPAQS